MFHNPSPPKTLLTCLLESTEYQPKAVGTMESRLKYKLNKEKKIVLSIRFLKIKYKYQKDNPIEWKAVRHVHS